MSSDFLPPEPDNPEEELQRQPRQGKARERQRRRRERQKSQGAIPSSRSEHLSPSGGIQTQLPKIRIPYFRMFIGIAIAVILVLGVIEVLRRLKPPELEVQPNALWIGTEWTYELQEPESVEALAQRLQANRIGTVYAWVSWLQEDATWRGAENFAKVRTFATQMKQAYPQATLYGWVSFPANLDADGYRLDDEELQQNIADFSASVVGELGYDGVFLNIEPVWDGDEAFLSLLRKVRSSVGENIPISVAVPPDWSPEDADIPVPPLIVPGTVWSREYKQSVALLTNQMAIMAYNSGLSAVDDYVEWMAYQVETFAEAVSELGEGTNVIIGIPTYDAEPPGHDPAVENVVSALQGYSLGLAQAGDAAAFVQGIAVYADWETDETEWEQFGAWVASR